MGYDSALAAAGATVLRYEEFGDYQGSWVAEVEYNGKTGFVHGYYGSCSYCDALQAALDDLDWEDRVYEKGAYQETLAKFGASYLDDLMTADEVRKQYSEDAEWDSDSRSILDWLGKECN